MDHKPWLNQYDAGVPHTLQPYPAGTLLDVVSETARRRPDLRVGLSWLQLGGPRPLHRLRRDPRHQRRRQGLDQLVHLAHDDFV